MDNIELVANMLEIKSKLDRLLSMVEDMHTLAIYGKRTGLEDNSLNSARAAFIIKRRYNELAQTLGMDIENLECLGEFENKEFEQFKERCEGIIEYIITAYDDVLPNVAEYDKEFSFEKVRTVKKEEDGVEFSGENLAEILEFMGGAQ